MTSSSSIFTRQLTSAETAQSASLQTGMLRTLADLAKAAYDVDHPDYSEYVNLNDRSPNSDTAWQEAANSGWQPLSFSSLPAVGDRGAIKYGMTSDGFFINQNAAALVMRSDDAVVISFRGTNDYSAKTGVINPYDPSDAYHPDKDDWTTMNEHYALFSPLISALDAWVAANGISKVYVTGHSMGGAMALEYMSRHSGSKYEAVTFAATPFSLSYFLLGTERKDYYDDSRITQVEIALDTAPMMFDWRNPVGNTNNRPGQLISFAGNQTLDRPNQINEAFGFIDYWGRTANHSMDYYRQIVDSVDAAGWQAILNEPGDTSILLGGRNQGDTQTFVVDGKLSGSNALYDNGNDQLIATTQEILFGGRGNDLLTAGSTACRVLAGDGNDSLRGGAGNDTLDGGAGRDTADYSNASAAVILNLSSNSAQLAGNAVSTDVLLNIENLQGSSWDDQLTGNAEANQLIAGAGKDSLDGGLGADTLRGGAGDDLYRVDQSGDVVVEYAAEGTDRILARLSWTLGSNQEELYLLGTGSLSATGNTLANRLSGNSGNNRLQGNAGNDSLYGGLGNDTLTGGAGKDLLSGGDGQDLFRLLQTSDSGTVSTSRDTLVDFLRGTDRIDLSALDANTSLSGNQAFSKLLSPGAHFTMAGQLQLVNGLLYGNTDSDASAEFSIAISGINSLGLADFIL